MPARGKKVAPADRDRAKKGIRARQDAIKTLIQNHQHEFDELHVRNRIAQGLPPTNNGPTREELEAKIRRQEETLAKNRELLRLTT